MSLLSPPFLLLSLLALPILLLYMLKLRRREVQVSSTLLWQMLLRDRQANSPWQKIKRNLLLFLQLLTLGALVLALARPALWAPSLSAGSTIVLLDASASMNATDVAPSRFETARQLGHDLINTLEVNHRMTLILVGRQPVILASAESDKAILRRALNAAEATKGTANWEAAFALAASAAASEEETTIVILSDGGLPDQGLPAIPGQIRYLSVGVSSGENVAISALALRSTGTEAEMFASLHNYGEAERDIIFSLYADDSLLTAQRIVIPAGQEKPLSLENLPSTARIYRAQISAPGQTNRPLDAFSLDNVAFAVYRPSRTGRTLLISPGNFFLEQVLASLPGIQPFRAVPNQNGNFALTDDPFDLYIFDSLPLPTDLLPSGSLLLINPTSNPIFVIGDRFPVNSSQLLAHPLTTFVDWSNVHIAEASQVALPIWAEALVQTEQGPLVFVGETDGRRIAVFTFDLHASDLPLQVAFPILFANLINYLIPAQAFEAPNGLQPGEEIRILPEGRVSRVIIVSPQGKAYSMPTGENGILFSQTEELGVYTVNYLSDGEQNPDNPKADFFAVNLFSEQESNLRPAQGIQIGGQLIAASAEDQLSRRELWPWLGATALIILCLEWWIYHRQSIPRILKKEEES